VQQRVVDPGGPAVQVEQRFVRGHEVADLRDELDDPIQAPRLRHQCVDLDREHDVRSLRLSQDALRRAEPAGRSCGLPARPGRLLPG